MLFGSLQANDEEHSLPRVFVSHLGMLGPSAGEDVMKESHVFAIVKYASCKYKLLQGYGSPALVPHPTDLNILLKSNIPCDRTFGDINLDRFQTALRAFLDKGARADSNIHALTFTSMEMKGPRLPCNEQDPETLVSKLWGTSKMVAVSGLPEVADQSL